MLSLVAACSGTVCSSDSRRQSEQSFSINDTDVVTALSESDVLNAHKNVSLTM